MRTFMTTHRVNIAVAMWWYLVIGGAGLSAVEEAAAIENAKAIKIEKLLTLIRISELESEYESLTQKYMRDYEHQIRKSIESNYPNVTGGKKEGDRTTDRRILTGCQEVDGTGGDPP